jgi:hypothetical protein
MTRRVNGAVTVGSICAPAMLYPALIDLQGVCWKWWAV